MLEKTKDNRAREFKQAAREYYMQGLKPLPLRYKSKAANLPKDHPFLEREATTEELGSFDWSGGVAIALKPSGLWVLDVDSEGALQKLKQLGWPTPATPTVKTDRGYHFYFKAPEGVDARTVIKWIDGVDVKTTDYVVAPPSIHPTGRVYEWVPELGAGEVEIAGVPEWLLGVAKARRAGGPERIDSPISEGARNDKLCSLAGSMRRRGLPEKVIGSALRAVNSKWCEPPLDEREVDTIARSVARYEPGSSHGHDGEERFAGILLSEVEPEQVRWLWEGRIPCGKITIVDGDPGLGKSAMTVDLAARITVGSDFPDGASCEPGGVVLASAEDGLADTIRPRLDAAGGDPSKVVALSTVPDEEGGERPLSIPDDTPLIEEAIERVKATLVIIDPLMAALSEKADAHKDQQVRRALTPLAKMAEKTGAAVVVVRHLNKGSGGNALYRGGGSIGIIGAARSGLIVAKHRDNEDLRVLAPVKNNLAQKVPSLAFAITTADNGAARVEWRGKSTLSADELLDAAEDLGKKSALSEAKTWLAEELKDGPVEATLIEENAEAASIAKATVRRAKRELAVQSKKNGNGSWTWHLPNEEDGKATADA